MDVVKTDVTNGIVALNISLTNDVNNDRILSAGEFEAIYKIKASATGVDCIKSIEDLSAFWHTYQGVLDEILNKHGAGCQIHLFPAMPVSAAFEVGRRYMLNTHPSVTIFDENNGFFETLKMGVNTDDR